MHLSLNFISFSFWFLKHRFNIVSNVWIIYEWTRQIFLMYMKIFFNVLRLISIMSPIFMYVQFVADCRIKLFRCYTATKGKYLWMWGYIWKLKIFKVFIALNLVRIVIGYLYHHTLFSDNYNRNRRDSSTT